MNQNLGPAYETAALPFGSAGFPATIDSSRLSSAAPRLASGSASLKHSLYASTFLIAYLGVFFAAGYAALSIVEWAWASIVP
jgi:hypothetical protein